MCEYFVKSISSQCYHFIIRPPLQACLLKLARWYQTIGVISGVGQLCLQINWFSEVTGAAFKAWEDEKNQLPNKSEFNKSGVVGAGIVHACSCINTVEMEMNTSLEKLGDSEKKSLKAAL